jgi:FixJ family two-component response regulator
VICRCNRAYHHAYRVASVTSGSKIYVVDDDEGVRDSLTILLESEGWQVDSFENGQDFMAAYVPSTSSCLLLDLNMPVMGGREVIDALKDKGDRIPVIVITSVEDPGLRPRLQNLGVTEVLEKPLDHDLLFEVINMVT